MRPCGKTTFQTEMGQLVDLITAPEDDRDLKLPKLAEVRDEVDGNRRREAARGADER